MEKEIKVDIYNKFKIINDYFTFIRNDIDLYKIEKCFNEYFKEFELNKEDLKVIINEKYTHFIQFLDQTDLAKFTFPSFKNSIMSYIHDYCSKGKNKYEYYYFFMLILSNKHSIIKPIKKYYVNIIKNNHFGTSFRFSDVITKDVMGSSEYLTFVDSLADWYTEIEIIIFYLTILNDYFNVKMDFDYNMYSIDKNFDFSMKSFAKKNFLKLASYIFKKSSIKLEPGKVDYKRILLLLVSSFSCGISIKDVFIGGDLSQIAYFSGGFIANFLIGKIADKTENYSNLVEFSRLKDIIFKLNRKLYKINKKVYELVKLKIITEIDINSKNSSNTVYPCVEEKIEDLLKIIKKYFEGVQYTDEEVERKLIKDALKYESLSLKNSTIDDSWAFIVESKK